MAITNLQEALPVPLKGRATLPLIDLPEDTKLVLVAMDTGVEIAPHQAPYPASVQLLSGRIDVLLGEGWKPVVPGGRVFIEEGLTHAVRTFEPSYFLVTHLRGRDMGPAGLGDD